MLDAGIFSFGGLLPLNPNCKGITCTNSQTSKHEYRHGSSAKCWGVGLTEFELLKPTQVTQPILQALCL